MSRPLYDISKRFENLWNLCLDDNVDLDSLENAIQSVEGELEDKVANGIAIIQDLKFHADAMGDEAKRLALRKKAIDNKIDWLKSYYLDHLSKMGKSKVLTNLGTMSIAKAGGKRPLKIDDENLIPNNFKFIVHQINKDALRTALESGESVQGAHLEDRGLYLKIF